MNLPLRRSIAVIALALTPVLSSCGFDQPTDRVYTPGVGVNERSGSVDVLNALVVSGSDGSGTLVASLSNNDSAEADRLTEVAGSGEDAGLQVKGRAVDVEAGSIVSLPDDGEFSVRGDAVTTGAFLELTFRFERGDAVTVEVPVVDRRGPYTDIPVP